MNEIQRLLDELRRAFDGDAWHGPPLMELLHGLTAGEARAHPIASAHSIWEIARHLEAWMGEARERLRGSIHPEPVEGDWPEIVHEDEDAWRGQIARLIETHERLLDAVQRFPEAHLGEMVGTPVRDRIQGSGVTYYVLLHGIAQHAAYHAGQIALLRKAGQR